MVDYCCPRKYVGNHIYWFSGVSEDAYKYGCSNDCAYTMQGGDPNKKYCFKPGPLESVCDPGYGYGEFDKGKVRTR